MAYGRFPLSRREFLGAAGALATTPLLRSAHAQPAAIVNDVHSQLNETRVRRVATPRTVDDVQAALRAAVSDGYRSAAAGTQWAASSSAPTQSSSTCGR
jgi:FAD/FMN-containing dehydrogenase